MATEQPISEAQHLRAAGKSLQQIATVLGVARTTVWKWLEPEKYKAKRLLENQRRRKRQKERQLVDKVYDEHVKTRQRERVKAYYKNNPDKKNKQTKEQRQISNAKRQKRIASDLDYRCKMVLKYIKRRAIAGDHADCTATIAEMRVAYEKQGGCCRLCGNHENTYTKHLAADHCHITGKFRGWLCHACNTRLGFLEKTGDPVSFMQRIIEYLDPS